MQIHTKAHFRCGIAGPYRYSSHMENILVRLAKIFGLRARARWVGKVRIQDACALDRAEILDPLFTAKQIAYKDVGAA